MHNGSPLLYACWYFFFAPDKFFDREAEQNVQDADENDPIAREMSNLDILDKLEKQATRESHYQYDCF